MTGNEFYVFLICVLIGSAGGVLYDVIYLIRAPFSSRVLTIVGDLVFGVLFAGLFLFVSVTFALPGFRFYMLLGSFLGLLLYLKSIHETVAFFQRKVYTIYKNKRTRGKRKCESQRKKRRGSQSAQP